MNASTKKPIIMRTYVKPEIIEIKLDNEISLILESTPPSGPNEVVTMRAPEQFDTDPFITNRS